MMSFVPSWVYHCRSRDKEPQKRCQNSYVTIEEELFYQLLNKALPALSSARCYRTTNLTISKTLSLRFSMLLYLSEPI